MHGRAWSTDTVQICQSNCTDLSTFRHCVTGNVNHLFTGNKLSLRGRPNRVQRPENIFHNWRSVEDPIGRDRIGCCEVQTVVINFAQSSTSGSNRRVIFIRYRRDQFVIVWFVGISKRVENNFEDEAVASGVVLRGIVGMLRVPDIRRVSFQREEPLRDVRATDEGSSEERPPGWCDQHVPLEEAVS